MWGPPYLEFKLHLYWYCPRYSFAFYFRQVLVNTAYCLLILIGKLIQHLIFGELRVAEAQHLKDRFWNFVFYKFIFIFGVLNVQHLGEVLTWG